MIRVKPTEQAVVLNLLRTLREVQARRHSGQPLLPGAIAIGQQMEVLEHTDFWRELNATVQTADPGMDNSWPWHARRGRLRVVS